MKCHPANQRFYDRFARLRDAAEAEGRRRQSQAFWRVLQSLRRYPLPVRSAHDASILEGVARGMMSVFQEVLEGDGGEEGEAAAGALPAAVDDREWRVAAGRRFSCALQHANVHGGPGRIDRAALRAVSARSTVRSASARTEQEADVAASGLDSAPATAAAVAEGSTRVPSRASTCGRWSRVVKQRLSTTCAAPPPTGSAEWCMLAALGLHAGDAPHRVLAWQDIEAAVEKLRPQLVTCDRLRAAAGRLGRQGLVKEVDGVAYYLTDRGRAVADKVIRGLEVSVTVLSPIREHRRAGEEESDDDKPLCRLAQAVAHAATPQKKRSQADPRKEEATALAAFCPSFGSSAHFGTTGSPPEWAQQSPCSAEPANGWAARAQDMDFGAFQYDGEPSAHAGNGLSTPPRKRRKLWAALSAPPLPSSSLRASPAAKRCPAPMKATSEHLAPECPTTSTVGHRQEVFAASREGPVAADPKLPAWPSGGAQLKLLLDHREVGAGREHAARGALLEDLASKLGAAAVEARALPLGDVLWVWCVDSAPGSPAQPEVLAGWILERKTFHDLSASITDGRYDEQKMRLLEAPGLDGVVYLIEGRGQLFGVGGAASGEAAKAAGKAAAPRGFGQRLLKTALPAATLSTAAVHTQIISGFQVVHTASTTQTVSLLAGLHKALLKRGPPWARLAAVAGAGPLSYRDFAEKTRKSCHPRVLEAFGRMLRVVPHCGPEATEALVGEFQTPHALAVALRDSSDTDLLLRLKARHRGGRAPISAAALAACRELFAA